MIRSSATRARSGRRVRSGFTEPRARFAAACSLGSELVELERDGVTSPSTLEGTWNPDGFAGTLAELADAIAEDREPFNSARHNLLSLAITLAACRSAEEGSRLVSLDE